MNYLESHRRSRSSKSRRTFLVVGVVVLLFASLQYFAPYIMAGFWNALVNPFWRMEFAIESGALASPQALLEENAALERKLAEAVVRLETIGAIETENVELKELLGRKVSAAPAVTTGSSTETMDGNSVQDNFEPPYNRLLAAVLARPPLAAYDMMVIDVGADYMVQPGDKVYASGDILIGTVSSVTDSTSKVELYSSPGRRLDVLIGKGNVPATAVGRGGGQYEAELPRETPVNVKDFVVAPSLRDKPFGSVVKILSDPALPFEVVLIAPPVNIYHLRWVLVEKS